MLNKVLSSLSIVAPCLWFSATSLAAEPAIPYINASVNIDGKIDETVWQQAKFIAIDNVTWPYENTQSPVTTSVRVFENGQSLFLAFDAKDPDPAQIRAFFRDRDRSWNDDLVGIKIDSFNNGRSAYQFFINPLGVQQDSIENVLSGSEDSSWNGIWDSAGQINDSGYVVEVEIPLRVLNFDDSQDTKTMAMEFLRFYPRSERLRISSMQIAHENQCWVCQMPAFTGFSGAKQNSNLAVIPAMVVSQQQTRDIDGSTIPDWENDTNYEPGLDVKWAITPDTTLNATLNPDFSQVEADNGQLSVNNSFSLFFPEKRAFFLDNADYFSSHINLLHTRNIAAPDYGAKLTGSKQGHTYAAFVTNDEFTNVMVPGNLGSSVVSLEQKSENAALRYRYDANETLSVGALTTTRQSEDYKNQLLSLDGKYEPTANDTFKVQILTSKTDYDPAMVKELCDDETLENCEIDESVLRTQLEDDNQGLGYMLDYRHNQKHWKAFASYRNYDAALRADMGFLSQVDFNKFVTGFEYRWYGDEQTWWNRTRWYTDWDISHNENGELLEKEIQSNIAISGPLQSTIDFGVDHRKRTGLRHDESSLAIDGNTDLFSENTQWIYLESKPAPGVFSGLTLRTGNRVDLANNRMADERYIRPLLDFYLGQHFEVRLRHTYQKLTADGMEVFTANLSDIRFTYQFNINSYLRLAFIKTDIRRNQANYIDDVDSQYKRLSTQLLYAYKLNPQTVFFAGYSDNGYQDDDLSKISKDNKTFFAKFSYAWLL
ncbi:carbohydrate binding family 9 domain-containing protein [Pseudoalteromonas rubra]|uniref:carbohydrate binding family 9 domain-containing protein n=1 Tax=Pseudoalteromonas rubra TaxID=43658 RepID=UPI000F7B1842|nr:carbohydrate binding family 9 domain-containing protein [Pseudoalteromonas rubra]